MARIPKEILEIKKALDRHNARAAKKFMDEGPYDIPHGDGWLITAGEIANAIGVCDRTVERMIARGDLPFVRKMGAGRNHRLFCSRGEIEDWKARCMKKNPPEA